MKVTIEQCSFSVLDDLIPGTKRRSYLEENVAAEAVRLDPADMSAIDEALGPGKIAGPRYPEWIMATVDR